MSLDNKESKDNEDNKENRIISQQKNNLKINTNNNFSFDYVYYHFNAFFNDNYEKDRKYDSSVFFITNSKQINKVIFLHTRIFYDCLLICF